MKQRQRRLVVIGSVLAALLIGLVVTAYTQRNNLQAFLLSMRYSEEELAALQEQSLKDLLDKYGLDPIPQNTAEVVDTTDVPSDDTPALPTESSEAPTIPNSAEAADPPANSIRENNNEETIRQDRPAPPSKGAAETRNEAPPQDAHKDPSKALPQDVQKLVYSLHSLQSQYIGKLDGLAASTRTRFDALPSEKRNGSTRASMVKATLSQAIALEDQCDSRVASIIRELRTTLKKHGMDDSVADNAEHYYATQKGLLKAEYMRKYNKYLK
ncbi:MAG: hypothetical protein IKC50_07885 [Oscillospiraceae bacterium]|nr:hypothetical protein [Oscillospiraceae bacterium]